MATENKMGVMPLNRLLISGFPCFLHETPERSRQIAALCGNGESGFYFHICRAVFTILDLCRANAEKPC